MLAHSAYGKSSIRIVQVRRGGNHHSIHDLTVAIRFEGDYAPSYVDGDNRDVLPTDTMKNTVYALAARVPVTDPEPLGVRLGDHFLSRNPQLRTVRVELSERMWRPITVGGRDHGQAFMQRGPELRTAIVQSSRDGTAVSAGVADLLIMKTAHSGFSGFPRDEYTTLPETRDRLLATSLTASWRYEEDDRDYGSRWHAVRQTLLESFAEHVSESVQHTLYAMGKAVLDTSTTVASIHLTMPNKHHLPFDLERIGLANRNEIFVATDEPYGLIEATLSRDAGAGVRS
jgi:urate oxidase